MNIKGDKGASLNQETANYPCIDKFPIVPLIILEPNDPTELK